MRNDSAVTSRLLESECGGLGLQTRVYSTQGPVNSLDPEEVQNLKSLQGRQKVIGND